jgi:ceramide glucosyltransferase
MENLLATGFDWLSLIFYAGALLGCTYALAAAWVADQFLGAAVAPPNNHPAVTILKPLHGIEPHLLTNLTGFCVQNYPSPIQIVFGVADADDPAIAIVRDLIGAFPDADLKLVVCASQHGANRKVSNLINMAAAARHDIFVISDSDIAVDRNYLKTIAASLGQQGVGLVSLLYRGIPATGPWAALAAAAIDYHFLPGVLVGLKLGLATPCFGSTIALHRNTLARIGGFEAVADLLADDYALGARVRGAGLSVAIPPATVGHICAEQSLRELVRHELRWARTIRAVDPIGFAGSAITHATPLALLGDLLGGITPASIIVVVAIACRFALQHRLDRVFRLRQDFFWLGPIRDVLSFSIFVASFFASSVEWRGRRYGVKVENRIAYPQDVEP